MLASRCGQELPQRRGLAEQHRTHRDDRPKRGAIGATVTNPINGEALPIWIADYVLADYGTGAVMGVPAHDQRDMVFAKSYGLAIRQVIDAEGASAAISDGNAWTEPGVLIHSGAFDGNQSTEAKTAITAAGAESGWAAAGHLPPSGLADLPPALLGLPDPRDSLPQLRNGPGASR